MNVKQLIEKLSHLDPEMMVVISGYEGGVDEASSIDEIKIKLDTNDAWYYGAHEVVDHDESIFDCKGIHIH